MWGLISHLRCSQQQLPLGLLGAVLKCCSPERRTLGCVHTKHGWNAIIFQSWCLSFSALKRWLLLENNAKPLIMKLSRKLCAQLWLSFSVFVILVKHPIRFPSKSREMRLTMETKLFNCYYLWKFEVLFFFLHNCVRKKKKSLDLSTREGELRIETVCPWIRYSDTLAPAQWWQHLDMTLAGSLGPRIKSQDSYSKLSKATY